MIPVLNIDALGTKSNTEKSVPPETSLFPFKNGYVYNNLPSLSTSRKKSKKEKRLAFLLPCLDYNISRPMPIPATSATARKKKEGFDFLSTYTSIAYTHSGSVAIRV